MNDINAWNGNEYLKKTIALYYQNEYIPNVKGIKIIYLECNLQRYGNV